MLTCNVVMKVLRTMIDLSEGSLVEEQSTTTVSTGLFWGPSLSIVGERGQRGGGGEDGGQGREDGMSVIGGGAFWGGTRTYGEKEGGESGESREGREGRERREAGAAVDDVSSSEGEEEEEHHEQHHEQQLSRKWQQRRRVWSAKDKKRRKRAQRFTRFVCHRLLMQEHARHPPRATVDLSDRAPNVGGIGALSKATTGVTRTPMLTSCCRLPGSVNQGRGEYGVVTIVSCGGGDVVVTAVSPSFSSH